MTQHLSRALLVGCALLARPTVAQVCPAYGSTPIAATWTPAPVSLGCLGAPAWPQWHLYTPRHRAPNAHRPGFRPGVARQRGALLVPYACTGLLLAPIALQRVRVMGYVVDLPEHPCR